MEQRGVNEIDVRRMLEHTTGWSSGPVSGRFLIRARFHSAGWTVIVEPEREERRLVIVTVFADHD
jgi:hypothetical protein